MRETVRSLSDVGVRILEGELSSVREDLGETDLWCSGCPAKGKGRVAMFGRDKR